MMVNKNCKHAKKHKNRNCEYCISCGCVLLNSNFSIKSKKYYYLIDHSPESMFEIMRKSSTELVNNTNSVYLKDRPEIIKELRIYFEKLLYSNQVFYLAINYLDIVTSILKDRYDLVSLCCLSLAAKFDESDLNDLVLNEMESKKFSMYELKKYEVLCLKQLKYKLGHFTAYHFISFFIAHGFVFSDDIVSDKELTKSQSNKDTSLKLDQDFLERLSDKVYYNAKEILFHFLDDPNFLKFLPLHIACACVSISREVNKIFDLWPLNMEKIYSIKFDEFSNCFFTIQKSISLKKIPNSELSRYFSIKKNSSDSQARSHLMKRNSLTVDYEGAKILSSIEDMESLNNLKDNLINNMKEETEEPQIKFIRDSKKKQTVMNKSDFKIEKPREDTNLEAKMIKDFENKMKIQNNLYVKKEESKKVTSSNNIIKIDSNNVSSAQKIFVPDAKSKLKK